MDVVPRNIQYRRIVGDPEGDPNVIVMHVILIDGDFSCDIPVNNNGSSHDGTAIIVELIPLNGDRFGTRTRGKRPGRSASKKYSRHSIAVESIALPRAQSPPNGYS